METIVKVIFGNDADAYAAQRAVTRLDDTANVSVGETYVIRNDGHGNAVLKSSQGETTGVGTVSGVLFGGLVGLLGGPVGAVLGGTAGLLIRATGDLVDSTDIDDYLDGFAKQLAPGQTMLVAHLWEDFFAPVDTALKPYGGQLTRLDVNGEIDKADRAEAEAIDREIARQEAAEAASDAADKAEHQAKLAEWKRKREENRQQRQAKAEQRNQRYQNWLNEHRKKYEDRRSEVDEKIREKKRERLQKEINEQQEKLTELRQKERVL